MKICPFMVRGIQNLDVAIYPAVRFYRKFTFATPKFTKKMYVVL